MESRPLIKNVDGLFTAGETTNDTSEQRRKQKWASTTATHAHNTLTAQSTQHSSECESKTNARTNGKILEKFIGSDPIATSYGGRRMRSVVVHRSHRVDFMPDITLRLKWYPIWCAHIVEPKIELHRIHICRVHMMTTTTSSKRKHYIGSNRKPSRA